MADIEGASVSEQDSGQERVARDERQEDDPRDTRDSRAPGEARDERDERLPGDPRDVRDPLLTKDTPDLIDRTGFPSDRLVRAAALFMIVLVVVGVMVMVGLVIRQGQQIAALNERTGQAVLTQNETQLCAQHDIVIAVRKIGEKLGLPVDDIAVPNVEGLDCP
jgi:hypothetical protein